MGFTLSDRDRLAVQAAAAIRQQNLANETLGGAKGAYDAAQEKQKEGGLGGVLAGIGEKIGDFGSTLNNIGKTIFGGMSQGQSEAKSKQIRADDSTRRNEIAKKYGYNSYSDAMNDDNASEDFWNEIRSSNQKTKDALSQKRESENNSYGNVKNIDLNKAKGQALNSIGTVLDVAPGLGIAGNALSGVVEGLGDAYKSAEGGTAEDVWGNGNLNTTLGRMAAGGTSGLVGGKVAKNLGPAKTVLGNVGKAAVSGAASGATAGGIMGAATGQDILQSAIEGGMQGAEGGAIMGGANAATAKLMNAAATRGQKATSGVDKAQKNMLTEAEKLDIQDSIADLKNQRNNAAVRKDFGFQDVQARRDNYAKSLPDAYGELQAQGLSNRKDMVSANKRLNNSESGTFQKARRNILSNSADIELKSGKLGLDDASLQKMAQDAMLSGKNAKDAISDVNALLGSRLSGDDLASQMSGRTKAIDADDILKKLESASKDARKAQGSSSLETNKSKFYDNVAKTLSDAIDESTQDTFGAFRNSPDRINALFATVEKQHPEYANYLRQELSKANSLSDMRSLMQNLTIVSKANENAIANNSSAPSVNAQTFMGNLKDRNVRNIPTSPIGVAKNAAAAFADTAMGDKESRQIKAIDKQIAKYEKALGDGKKGKTKGVVGNTVEWIKARNALDPQGTLSGYVAGQADIESPVGKGILGKSANAAMEAAERATILDAINPNTTANIAALNDILTRPIAGGTGINTLGNIENRIIAENIANNTANRPELQAAQNAYNTAVLDAANAEANLNNIEQAQLAQDQTSENTQQLQIISSAMDAALAAGDLTSYGKLADLYQQAYKIYGESNKSNLSTKQQSALEEANNSLAMVDQLESAFNNAGGGQGFVQGNANEFINWLTGGNANSGLNTYNALKQSLGTSIVKNVVNLGGTEADAQRYLAMLPSATDTPAQASQKLDELRKMLNNTKANIGSKQ